MTHDLPSAPDLNGNEHVVVAHLGAHKTATSLVQRYFKDKRSIYAKQGLDVITRSEISPKIGWGKAIVKDPMDLNKMLKNRRAKFKGPYTLFSNENSLGKPIVRKPGLYPYHERVLPSLEQSLEGFRPRIVFTVRPSWEFLESYYLQKVRQGYFLTFNQFIADVNLKALSWTPLSTRWYRDLAERMSS